MNLAITGFGMTTAVGHDAATSCAAIRAGISRAAPLPHAKVLDPDSQTLVPVNGHQVWGLTEGGSAISRWLNMAQGAFEDLCRNASLPGADDADFWRRVAVAVITPVLDDNRFTFSMFTYPQVIRSTYVEPLMRALAVPIAVEHVYVLSEGRSGALRALASAENLLARNEVERLLIVAADSYLDGYSLQWLGEAERLKAAEQPSGLMPGEAAVAVLVEHSQHMHGVAAKARIRAVALDREAADYSDGERKHGRALARALRAVVASSGNAVPFDGDLIADLNGEAWCAYEFGAALSQISSEQIGNCRSVLPAMSTGDVGAASALLAIALASRAFERGYATHDAALVSCMSHSGLVGATLLERY